MIYVQVYVPRTGDWHDFAKADDPEKAKSLADLVREGVGSWTVRLVKEVVE